MRVLPSWDFHTSTPIHGCLYARIDVILANDTIIEGVGVRMCSYDPICEGFGLATRPRAFRVREITEEGCDDLVRGYEGTPCADHDTDPPSLPSIYVSSLALSQHTNLPDVFIINVDGVCYEVDTAGSDMALPLGGTIVDRFYTWFEVCVDCTGGVQAQLCPDNNPVDTSAAPDIWVRVRDLPDSTIYFQSRGYCYSLDPNDPVQTIPTEDVVVATPRGGHDNCDDCRIGISAQLCPDQPNADAAPELWVAAGDLPATAHVWNYKGWCYSIDPEQTPQLMPLDARVVVPIDQFESCEACRCGPPRDGDGESCGVKVQACENQPEAEPEDLWVRCDDLPDQEIVFEYRGVCYHVSPLWPQGTIPKGALAINPSGMFETCWHCRQGIGGELPPYDPPPLPCTVPPCPESDKFYELLACPNDTGTNKWVRENHICATFNVVPCDLRGLVFEGTDGKCYKVGSTSADAIPGGGTSGDTFLVAGPAPVGGCGYRLSAVECDENTGLADKYTFSDLSAHVGRVVKIAGDEETCWTVSEADDVCTRFVRQVAVTEDHADCEACEGDPTHSCEKCGKCCFSDLSRLNFTKPTAVWKTETCGEDDYELAVQRHNATDTTSMPVVGMSSSGMVWKVESDTYSHGGITYKVVISIAYSCSTNEWAINTTISMLAGEEWIDGAKAFYGGSSEASSCCSNDFTLNVYPDCLGALGGTYNVAVGNNKCCADLDGAGCTETAAQPECDEDTGANTCLCECTGITQNSDWENKKIVIDYKWYSYWIEHSSVVTDCDDAVDGSPNTFIPPSYPFSHVFGELAYLDRVGNSIRFRGTVDNWQMSVPDIEDKPLPACWSDSITSRWTQDLNDPTEITISLNCLTHEWSVPNLGGAHPSTVLNGTLLSVQDNNGVVCVDNQASPLDDCTGGLAVYHIKSREAGDSNGGFDYCYRWGISLEDA